MSQLSSYASLANAGAQIYGQVRQGLEEREMAQAQRGLAQTQNLARTQALAADYDTGRQARATQLAQNLAGAAAEAGGAGLQPGDGSAGAVASGIRQRAAATQDAADQEFNTQLAAQPRSLLAPDSSFGDFLNAGRSFGSVLQSLIG
ncbi:hypothetical protein M0638_08070 [Roseomonas sp. NAR14]|uniref:Uncharacterized protein n=1 Tax=Roseomonas acroporae TaxID=2937791 RepID=A0A9X2BTH8_9PROT|nr:hypothetical protein [Roseomonas acroporae]MCK8784332.1 hypothetical protein [Roseomonas acroporae]